MTEAHGPGASRHDDEARYAQVLRSRTGASSCAASRRSSRADRHRVLDRDLGARRARRRAVGRVPPGHRRGDRHCRSASSWCSSASSCCSRGSRCASTSASARSSTRSRSASSRTSASRWIPEQHALAARIAFLALAIVGFGVGGGLYIGCGLGPGPRDGLMTAITARGYRLWIVRTVIECSVLVVGFAPRRQGRHRHGGDRAHDRSVDARRPAPLPSAGARRRARGDGGVKIVVIGTGLRRRVVAPVFAATDGCEVVDVVSPRDDDAVEPRDRASRRRPRERALAAVPARRARARRRWPRARRCLCDKPFALDADEAAALVAEAAAAGVVALCNFEFRFHPVRRLLRELVRTDALGPIEHVHWTHSQRRVAGRRCAATAGSSTATAVAAGSARGARTRSTRSAGASARSSRVDARVAHRRDRAARRARRAARLHRRRRAHGDAASSRRASRSRSTARSRRARSVAPAPHGDRRRRGLRDHRRHARGRAPGRRHAARTSRRRRRRRRPRTPIATTIRCAASPRSCATS